MHTLRSRDDLLAPDEHIKGVAIPRILRVWHGIERPHLHAHLLDQAFHAELTVVAVCRRHSRELTASSGHKSRQETSRLSKGIGVGKGRHASAAHAPGGLQSAGAWYAFVPLLTDTNQGRKWGLANWRILGKGASAPLVGSGTVHRSLCCTSSSQACPIPAPAPLSNRQGHQAASACRGVTSAEASGCRRYACDVERSQRAIYRLRQTYKCMHASNLHCSLFG